MNYYLDTLNDQELKHLVKLNMDLFLFPIRKSTKTYMKYSAMLGSKTKKSVLVQRNLPGIAVELFRKHDHNFQKAMEAAGMGATSQFFDCMKDYLGDEITPESVKRLSDEEMVRVINEFKIDNTNNPLDFELLWIQMKLLGFADIDNRKENILLLCGEDNQSSNIPENDKNDEIETNDAEQEEVANHSVTEEASVVEKRRTNLKSSQQKKRRPKTRRQ